MPCGIIAQSAVDVQYDAQKIRRCWCCRLLCVVAQCQIIWHPVCNVALCSAAASHPRSSSWIGNKRSLALSCLSPSVVVGPLRHLLRRLRILAFPPARKIARRCRLENGGPSTNRRSYCLERGKAPTTTCCLLRRASAKRRRCVACAQR